MNARGATAIDAYESFQVCLKRIDVKFLSWWEAPTVYESFQVLFCAGRVDQ